MTWQQWLVRLVLFLTGLFLLGALVGLGLNGELTNPAALVTLGLVGGSVLAVIVVARKSETWLANPYW
ncbi:hypothetical protein [Haladaptatus sp. DJG-WS-42]|uniref:hypothetical protein n=1 Tax=Haladaptatus sp. DJG-WS-42 TaxID=3120516 RepID=UPI0030D008B4